MNRSLEIIETPFGNFMIDEFDMIGGCIKREKCWELYLYDIYSNIITKDYYCIDAGANLGFHSIQFGRLGKKVYSFEPQSYIYNQLCTNILLNGLDNIIEPFKVGLGGKKEKKQLWNIEHELQVFGNIHNWGGRGIIQENYGAERGINNEFKEEDIINVISLDSLEIPKCDFLKIDVQGYEYNMMIGSKNLLENNKPIIFLENHINDWISEKTKQYIVELGYEFYRLNIGNKEDCILIHPESSRYNHELDIIKSFSKKYYITQE